MKMSPLTPLSSRLSSPQQRSEVVLRYAAAYGCTLIAIAAAQLIIPNPLTLLLAAVTLTGLPLSLFLRWSKQHIFGRQIPRFIINSTIVILTGFACFYLLLLLQPDLLERGMYNSLIVTTRSAGESIAILMNMFLVFAAIRSLAIINDKDAVLSAVPSFSVLLLLIVVHRGPQVVGYFLLWAIVAAILFSLDHRAESRRNLSGVVPSLVPGQDVKLSARGLATVMSVSLLCAVSISYYLSSRNPEERGMIESWIIGMAGRMTQLALNLPDVSVNSGPERQIDFSSGPALPSRAELWAVSAVTYDWKTVRPQYWRMFSLTEYNGALWSQSPGPGTSIALHRLDPRRWPPLRQQQNPTFTFRTDGSSATRDQPRQTTGNSAPRNERSQYAQRPQQQPSTPRSSTRQNQARQEQPTQTQQQGQIRQGFRRQGYDIATQHPYGERLLNSFGAPRVRVLQVLEARTSNVGFVPMLPASSIFRIRTEEPPSTIRVRQDGSIDPGVVQVGQSVLILSEVAPSEAYGLGMRGASLPPAFAHQRPNPDAVLPPAERRQLLQLPANVSKPESRIKRYAREVLRTGPANESNYRRARRLALAVQSGAVYTLRPPQIPEGRDAADYFLFENRRGYCTYFAGALTVLCRAAGIPARVVSGFVSPEWSDGGRTGILREANAHAWTEVWVEGWGWATVDATPADDRGQNSPDWWENWTDLFGATLSNFRTWLIAHSRTVIAGILLVLAALSIVTMRRGFLTPLLMRLPALRHRVKLTPDQSRRMIFRAYHRAGKKLARAFRRRIDWETPHEYLAAAEAALDLENPQPLRELTQLYARAQYSPAAIDSADGERAVRALRELSFRRRRAPKMAQVEAR